MPNEHTPADLRSRETSQFAALLTGSHTQDTSEWFTAVPGERMRVLAGRAKTAGAFTLVESIAAPGAATPLHTHQSADEIFFVLEGSMHFVCGAEAFDAKPGEVIHIPRGAHHGWVNAGGTEARLFALFTPGGIEEMFMAMPFTPLEGIPALAMRFDTFVVGPLVSRRTT